MNLEKLQARVELLKAEHQKAVGQVSLLTEQLDKSKAHVQMIVGHMNEASFQLQEVLNVAQPVPEIVDGQANDQSPE